MESVEHSGRKLAESARQMQRATGRIEDAADRRTELAGDRTVLAAERTYAAWVRTGLVALASGIGARKLLADLIPPWMILATGSVLILFAAFCFVAGVWRELQPVRPPPHPDTRHLPAWLLVLVNGFLALVALAALVGVWFGREP
ncbi:MAG TPA: DUF202 domain-containing protein [Xanthobacteraceae bacterium]|jgi:putative membrane protein